jgi:hypothetical protein
MNYKNDHFNSLRPDEAERLAILAEELGESMQIIGKILRHGYESYNPNNVSHGTNREMLQRELGDILCIFDMMVDEEDLCRKSIEERRVEKAKKIQKYLHHQRG